MAYKRRHIFDAVFELVRMIQNYYMVSKHFFIIDFYYCVV